ncbi:RING-H2 finger protein ATL68 [Striga hermonthica]|uniref:RING-H2 finger protein ATL68 n=1 Tax=Striga hermonthica TaxID=68872 RepID=A0A9N7NH92_STRHE|nr:RING-H2 finger protein ATL68 [Striga hermonthica]
MLQLRSPFSPIFPQQSNGSFRPSHALILPMSQAPPPPPPLTPLFSADPNSPPPPNDVSGISPGYAIAVALGFIVLSSATVFSVYLCFRSGAARRRRQSTNPYPGPNRPVEISTYRLPRVIFVAEDDDGGGGGFQDDAVGLDPAVISTYPKIAYASVSGGDRGNDAVCAICLGEYGEKEVLRVLPDCGHRFHVMCVDAWLKMRASCPVCRSSPLPTPMSTPLQEVVPLAQHTTHRRPTTTKRWCSVVSSAAAHLLVVDNFVASVRSAPLQLPYTPTTVSRHLKFVNHLPIRRPEIVGEPDTNDLTLPQLSVSRDMAERTPIVQRRSFVVRDGP